MASAKFDVFFGRMGGTASIEGLDVTPLSSRRVAVAYIFAIVGIGTPSQAELEAGCDLAEQKADALLAGLAGTVSPGCTPTGSSWASCT